MTTNTSKYFLALLVSASLAASAAFGQTHDPVLYTSNPVQTIEVVKDAAKKVGVSLGVITGGGGVLMRRLDAEKAAPQGDVFWSAAAGTLGSYQHLFEPYASPHLVAIPQTYHYPGNHFLPSNIHVVAFMINTDLLDDAPMPRRWSDLADPRWKNKIITADPNNSSMGHTIAWGMHTTLDAQTYKAIVSNLATTQSSSGVRRAVAQGEYPIGLVFEWNAYSYISGGQNEINMVYPEEGTFVSTEYLALVKNAPSGENAKKLVNVLLSRDTQIELLKSGFRRPSRADIKVSDHENLPELNAIKTLPIDEVEAARVREQFLADWDALPKAR